MACPALAPATPTPKQIRRQTIKQAEAKLRQIERRNAIAVEHLALAHQIADRAMRVMPPWVDLDDARQAAEHALLRCAAEYRERMPGYEQDGTFSGYATRRIYYAVLMARRAESRRLAVVIPEDHAAVEPSPETLAERVKVARLVRRCTEILTPRQIAVIVLHYWHGMTLVEVAQRMGISSPWASIQHTRALRAMREWMERRGIHGSEC